MFWWRIKQLKESLVQRCPTAREQLSYYIASGVVVSFTALGQLAPTQSALEVVVHWALWLAAIIFGTIYLYSCNGGATGKDFLPRLFAIGWVVAIRWSVVAIPLIIVIGSLLVLVVAVAAPHPSQVDPAAMFVVLYYLAVVLLIWRCGVHLREVALRSVQNAVTN
jgi:hypothetical protein